MHKQRKFKRLAYLAPLTLGVALISTYSFEIFPFAKKQEQTPVSSEYILEIDSTISSQMPSEKDNNRLLGNAIAVEDFSHKADEVQELISLKNEKNEKNSSFFSSLSSSFSNQADLDYFEEKNDTKLVPMTAPSLEIQQKPNSVEVAEIKSEKNPNAQITLSGYELKEDEFIVRKEVVKGDTIGSILEDYLSRNQLYAAIAKAKPIRNIETVRIGQSYEIVHDANNTIIRYEYEVDSEETFVLHTNLIKPEIDDNLSLETNANNTKNSLEQSAQKLLENNEFADSADDFKLEINTNLASEEELAYTLSHEQSALEEEQSLKAQKELQNQSQEQQQALVQTAQEVDTKVEEAEKQIIREFTFNCELVPVIYDIKLVTIDGSIQESLSAALADANEGYSLSYSIARIFADKIDFFSDIQKGDSFKLLVEKKYKDGKFVKYGKTLAAFFVNRKREYTAFRFENEKGHSAYFDKTGHSLQGLLLKSPLDYTRISSGYTMNRRHPILGIARPHQGIDYAAPSGTPIVSVGDGTVTFVGWKGGYGKTIVIRHTNGVESQYAHMRGYAKVSKKGAKVSKGQTIGYVGSTGLSTGPHLDFRIKQNGKFVNPASVVSEPIPPLKGDEKDRFLIVMDKINEYLNGTKALSNYNPDANLQDNEG